MSPPKFLPRLVLPVAMLALLVFGGFSSAKADTLYLLNQNNFGQAGTLGSITTHVIVAADGIGNVGCMLISVNLDSNYVIHSADALGWNVAAGFTGGHVLADSMGNVTTNPAGYHFTTGDGGSFDGYGSRTFSIDGETTSLARSHLEQTFSFIFCADQAFTDSAQVSGFAAQIALKTAGGATGFANSGPGTTIPEPTSMFLLGTGLMGIAAGLRRRRKTAD